MSTEGNAPDAGAPEEIEVTDEMVEAGLVIAWSAPGAQAFVPDQVRRIYSAMEMVRRANSDSQYRK
jgi:hypothetical protein